jgi:hypothetical protein
MTASSTDADQYDDDGDVLAALVAEHVQMDRDVFVIDDDTWAIHGYIAYDGQVIAATFASEKEAWAGLSRLEEIEHEQLA